MVGNTQSSSRFALQFYFAAIKNIGLLFALFMITRIVFVWYNAAFFQEFSQNNWLLVLTGCLQFDMAGILYVNLLYILLVLLPLPMGWRCEKYFQKTLRWIFVLTNSIALIANIVDTIYFEFSQRRTTWSIFNEFSNDNLLNVFGTTMLEHWLLVILGLSFFPFLYATYSLPKLKNITQLKSDWKYWVVTIVVFPVASTLIVLGIRGGVGLYVRPITISNANQYVNKPIESSVILNTPTTELMLIILPDFCFIMMGVTA